jgi:type IV pilus assembly protein PilV
MLNRALPQRRRATAQRGFTMIEVLIAVLVFSMGVLALVGLQATAARMANEARDRAMATFMADQLFARILISDPTALATVAHRTTVNSTCTPSGTASTNALVTGWLAEVAKVLPKATSARQQIVVNTATNLVTVRMCWQNGNDTPHSLSVTNQVQWQS